MGTVELGPVDWTLRPSSELAPEGRETDVGAEPELAAAVRADTGAAEPDEAAAATAATTWAGGGGGNGGPTGAGVMKDVVLVVAVEVELATPTADETD